MLSDEYHRRAIEQGDFTLSKEILEEKKEYDTIIILTTKIILIMLVVAVTIAVKLRLKVWLRTMYKFVNAESGHEEIDLTLLRKK